MYQEKQTEIMQLLGKIKKASIQLKIFYVCFFLFAYSAVIMCASLVSVSFAEAYSRGISGAFRYILSQATGIFDFSLAETLVILLPLLVLYILGSALYLRLKKIKSHIFLGSLSLILALAFVFVNTFGVCYRRNTLEHNLGLERKKLTHSQLYDSALRISCDVDAAVSGITFDKNGASVMPYSWDELNKKIDKGYEKLSEKYGFLSRCKAKAKRIALSKPMTYTHISGIYMPFTGEANVNTNYPDYIVAFTTAHEKAHQRGIAGEDEANFVAFLSCMESGDSYLSYSALMNMYDYFLSAAVETDEEMYYKLISGTNLKSLGEMYAYYDFFSEYRDSAASQVANTVNDSYLKSQGQEDGVESYGLVVELMAAYLNDKK